MYMRQSRNYNTNSLHKQKAPVKHIRKYLCMHERDTSTQTHIRITLTTAEAGSKDLCSTIECDQSVLFCVLSVAFFRLKLSESCAGALAS